MMEPAPEHDDTLSDFTSQISEKLKLAYPCASGSFGDVYQLAIKNSKGTTEVAVKVFRIVPGGAIEKTEKAIRRELIVWLRLKHPTMVPLLGTAKVNSPFPALVSQWMPSGTLYTYFEQCQGAITDLAKVQLAKGVADGLVYLHSNKVVHGDLHPANVLIDGSGNPRLTDFGLATVAGDAELQLSNTTVTRGFDPRWRAPEIIGIDPEADPVRPNFKSDVYSFGGVMFFIVSGHIPWKEKKNPYLIIAELSKGATPARPNYILDDCWNLIQKCWSSDPAGRPEATEVIIYIATKITAILRKTESTIWTTAPEMVKSTIWTTAPEMANSTIWMTAPETALSSDTTGLERQLNRSTSRMDDNLASGAVIMLQPITSGAHEVRPVAFDTDPHAIPPTSIRKQSEYPTSSGSLGDIWRCSMIIDSATSTEVAVKTIRIADIRNKEAVQKAKKRLRREVAGWVRFRHAHVLTLHGTVSGFGQLPALVFEWMHNGALDSYLKRTCLSTGQKLKLLKQVVDGLRYLHEQEVIHGDLTSTNVVIDHDGNAFLADFGLSVALAEADRSYYNSHSSGAVRWIAPELLSSSEPQNTPDGSDSDVDLPKPTSQSDVFSLGCIMLHVFSGRLPFWWLHNVQQIFNAQFKRVEPYRPEPSVTVSQQHLDFMRKCWSAEPQVRPSTGDAASFVEEELASVFSH